MEMRYIDDFKGRQSFLSRSVVMSSLPAGTEMRGSLSWLGLDFEYAPIRLPFKELYR
jgi:hypothetical protein